jgi:hypothetical protein
MEWRSRCRVTSGIPAPPHNWANQCPNPEVVSRLLWSTSLENSHGPITSPDVYGNNYPCSFVFERSSCLVRFWDADGPSPERNLNTSGTFAQVRRSVGGGSPSSMAADDVLALGQPNPTLIVCYLSHVPACPGAWVWFESRRICRGCSRPGSRVVDLAGRGRGRRDQGPLVRWTGRDGEGEDAQRGSGGEAGEDPQPCRVTAGGVRECNCCHI